MSATVHWLTNKPEGWVAVYLIVALTFCWLSVAVAAHDRDPWRVLISAALGLLFLALLRPIGGGI